MIFEVMKSCANPALLEAPATKAAMAAKMLSMIKEQGDQPFRYSNVPSIQFFRFSTGCECVQHANTDVQYHSPPLHTITAPSRYAGEWSGA